MAETRMTLPELNAELEKINGEIDTLTDRLEAEGIEEDVVEEIEVKEDAIEAEETTEDVEEKAQELIERKAEIVSEIEKAEKRNNTIAELKANKGEVVEAVEERNEKMDKVEVRKSAEYKDAFGEYLKKGIDALSSEQRALLTENAENGTIAVPVDAQAKINTAWENDEIMQRITKTFFKGNLKVGYEKSASGAVVHTEGGNAVEPENLVIEYTELIPAMLKKVVEVSDEVLATNDAMVDYLYDEIQYQLVKLAADTAVSRMRSSRLTAQYTLAGATPTTADIVNASGLLGGEASEPVVITTRAIAAQIKANALSAQYGYDPFDGMPVLYTDANALEGKSFIIADLTGVQANFPEGDDAKFKFDDYTKADADIVRIIGRLYAAIDVVASGKVVAAASA